MAQTRTRDYSGLSGRARRHIEPILRRIDPEKSYTPDEAAAIVGVSASLVYRAATVFHELGFVRLGKRKGVMIPGYSLREWVESRYGADAPDRMHSPREKQGYTPLDGAVVKKLRTARGEPMSALAIRSGVSATTISRIERAGEGAIAQTRTAESLAEGLNVTVKKLGGRPRGEG